MKFSPVLRLMTNQRVEVLKQVIKQSMDEAPQYLKKLKETNQAVMYDKISNLNKWYTNIIGLDEVKIVQDKVIVIQVGKYILTLYYLVHGVGHTKC